MHYTIYKITNKINNKYYVGMHKTDNLNDEYMGSGKLIRAAIKKYGIDNFVKEILFVFDNEEDMKNKEKELVVISEETYNLCDGGHGGFGHINRNGLNKDYPGKKEVNLKNLEKANIAFKKYCESGKHKELMGPKIKKMLKEYYPDGTFKGKKHKPESIERIKTAVAGKQTGNKNSQFGSIWITNGSINTKIKKDEAIPENWYKGRSL